MDHDPESPTLEDPVTPPTSCEFLGNFRGSARVGDGMPNAERSGIMSLLRTFTPLALMAVCLSGVACSDSLDDGSGNDDSAIINGTTSGTEDDAVVALYRRGQAYCGGTIIGQNVILTALHCVSEVTGSGTTPTIGDRIQPNEITIQIGANPGNKTAATVSRIVTEDPVRYQSTSSNPMSGNDIAILYVQPQNSAFSAIRPRRVTTTRSVQQGDSVTVVGYGGDGTNAGSNYNNSYDNSQYGNSNSNGQYGSNSQYGNSNSQYGSNSQYANAQAGNTYNNTASGSNAWTRRLRRSGVPVLAGPSDHTSVQSQGSSTQGSVSWTNKAREFTTDTVACGGDAGGPAFDTNGNVVGIVSGVVGQCVVGSLSVFTDVASHADFIQQSIQGVSNLGCLSDSQCGNTSSGQVCDARTNRCVQGCRSSGNSCGSGLSCSTSSLSTQYNSSGVGYQGICGSGNMTYGSTSNSYYDNGPYTNPSYPSITCPGNPLCPTLSGTDESATTKRECSQDTDCNGQNGVKPRVCDIPMGRCLDGCRVATAGMCPTGTTCGAYQEDPLIGLCQVSAPAVVPGVPATPPSYTPDATTSTSSTSTTAKKATTAAAASSCAVSEVGTSAASGFPMVLGLLGLALRRKKRA